MWFIGVEVEQETSAPPPKKNPGSAPAYRSPNLFWAFLCFGLELSPFFPKISSIHSTVSGKFCMYFVTDKNIVIWSYTVLSHTHAIIWGLGQLCLSGEWGGGSNAKRERLSIFRSPEAGISEFGKRILHYVTLLLQPSSHVLNLIK